MLREWMEKNLQEPFFKAEMVKTRINVAEGAEENLGTVKAMAVFGTLYMSFCAYGYAKYIFN